MAQDSAGDLKFSSLMDNHFQTVSAQTNLICMFAVLRDKQAQKKTKHTCRLHIAVWMLTDNTSLSVNVHSTLSCKHRTRNLDINSR